MDWTREVQASIEDEAFRRIVRACVSCTNDLKKLVSTPPPTLYSYQGKKFKKMSVLYSAKKVKATKGAPPRKVTGRGRASITYKVDRRAMRGYVGTNVFYMLIHEEETPRAPWGGTHKWVAPTMKTHGDRYNAILAGDL